MEHQNRIRVNDELIARYLSGEADPDEALAVCEWLENPHNRNHFDALTSAWYAAYPASKPRNIKTGEAWSSIHSKMVDKSRPVSIISYALAASLAVFIAAGLWIVLPATDERQVLAYTEDSTREIYLADKSAVTLNRNSKFSYPQAFSGKKREVTLLEGEGFFDVTANPEKPFVVKTAFGDIKVVGTMFNVMVENRSLKVGVKEGKVVVYTHRDSVLVLAGSAVAITDEGKSIVVGKKADLNDWGYATGFLVFQDTPLREVKIKIEKSYSCLIEIASPNIYNCRLTATFENVSAEEIVYLMAETLNLSVTENGKNFILKGKGCP